VNQPRGYYGYALQAGDTGCGNEDLLQALLDAGTEVNVIPFPWGTALHAAVRYDKAPLVRSGQALMSI